MVTRSAARARLGAAFGTLFAASIASNLADGLGRTAVPLIATTLTRDPLLISAVSAFTFVAWLLFGLPAGLLIDRVDRRIAMACANGLRVAMALVVALSITTGTLTIWLLYGCILVWGIGETVFDTATNAVLPSTVEPRNLEKANGRIQAAQHVVDTFIATPIAGVLFAAAIVLPVLGTAAGFAVSALLMLLLPLGVARAAAEPDAPQTVAPIADRGLHRLGREARQSLSFLWHDRLLRGLMFVTTATSAMLGLGQSAVILFLLDTMSVPAAALGFVMAGVGVGALVGAVTASGLVARFGRGGVMLCAGLVSGVGLALVGCSPSIVFVVAFYAVCAYAVSVWNVPWSALRQQRIPAGMLGRTIGVMRSITWGVIPLATVVGGAIARLDLRLPFVIGGIGVIAACAVGARLLLSIDRRVPVR